MKIFTTLLLLSFAGFANAQGGSHADLLEFFAEWRAFEVPPDLDGAPDYTAATFARRHQSFLAMRDQLDGFAIDSWPIEQQVDWHLVRAEMNGFDFNHRVLKPWVRDPAFYDTVWMNRSDVPGHEGPTNHAVVEVWTYRFPLSDADEAKLVSELRAIPPLMAQAQRNLTGNARDLWITGIRDIRSQEEELDRVLQMAGGGARDELRAAISDAKSATRALVSFLERESSSKTGPSGIGKENYTWYQQNVHLVPLTWEDEVRLLKRELDRAWSSLKLEEQRNRDLPPLVAASNAEEYAALAEEAVDRIIDFFEEKEILTVTPYMKPAIAAHLGSYRSPEERNFFTIASHYDPAPLFTHFYHWMELARMDLEPHPSPVRQGALLYNIFDSRNEGTATGVEEMFMHAGLYDDSPRSRELVWIMLAQRAARGLGSLYAHANEMTMEEAGGIHQDWTPRGWMKTEPDLMIFEQHLYLRQPGYGTSYITGKYLLERALADFAKQKEEAGEEFRMKDFFDRLNAIDSIPISLARWEMTGLDDEIRAMSAQ
ncbi:MAG: DUF885 family protein [Gammaproteobacteria bacterium]|nr:DUF885 family protein [Gammaproteobacteria bacterium]